MTIFLWIVVFGNLQYGLDVTVFNFHKHIELTDALCLQNLLYKALIPSKRVNIVFVREILPRNYQSSNKTHLYQKITSFTFQLFLLQIKHSANTLFL